VTVTFGELARVGRAHLSAAEAAAGQPTGGVAAAAAMMRRIAGILGRCLNDVVPYDMAETVTSALVDDRVRAAVSACEALRMAAAALPAPRDTPGDATGQVPGPLAEHLAEAADAVAAARDVLRTHIGTGAEGRWVYQSPWGAAVNSVPVVRAMEKEIAAWPPQLVALGARMFVDSAGDHAVPLTVRAGLAEACQWLMTAGALLNAAQRSEPATAADTELLAAIPLNIAGPRHPPGENETDAQLAQGIAGSGERLRASAWHAERDAAWSPAVTVTRWRRHATAAAVVCDISHAVLRMLASHPEHGESIAALGPGLHSAAEAASQACATWREAAAALDDFTTETHPRTGPATADSDDVVVRLGRIAFQDRQWTPGPRQAVVREPTDMVPDQGHLATVIGAVHHAIDALTWAGAGDLRAIETASRAGRLYVPTRTLPMERNVPHPFGRATAPQTRQVRYRYRTAGRFTQWLLEDLDRLAISTGAPSRTLTYARQSTRPQEVIGRYLAEEDHRVEPVASMLRGPENLPPPHAGPVERAIREIGVALPTLGLRARALDNAGAQLKAEAREAWRLKIRGMGEGEQPRYNRRPARLAATGFPDRAEAAAASYTARHVRSSTPAELGSRSRRR
jgi:hypothetical protein